MTNRPPTSNALCDERRVLRKKTAIGVAAACVAISGFQLRRLLRDDRNWVSSGGTADEKVRRTSARGSVTSLSSALSLGVFATAIDATCGVDPITSATMMSMIFGNTVGYVLDASFGGDSGLSKSKQSVAKGLRAAMQSLYSPNFARYVVTVLMDAHISSILLDRAMAVIGSKDEGEHGRPSSSFLHNAASCSPTNKLLPSLVTIVVGVTTFYAYTNATRFRFAIKDNIFPETPQEFAKRAPKTNALLRSVHDEATMRGLLDAASAETATWESVFGGRSRDDLIRDGFPMPDTDSDTTMRRLLTELQSPSDGQLDPSVVYLAACLAGGLYLTTPVGGGKGIHSRPMKVVTVFAQMALITGLVMSGTSEKAPKPPAEGDDTKGVAIFTLITALCVGFTFRTSSHESWKTMAGVLVACFAGAAYLGSKETMPYTSRGKLPLAICLGGAVATLVLAKGVKLGGGAMAKRSTNSIKMAPISMPCGNCKATPS